MFGSETEDLMKKYLDPVKYLCSHLQNGVRADGRILSGVQDVIISKGNER